MIRPATRGQRSRLISPKLVSEREMREFQDKKREKEEFSMSYASSFFAFFTRMLWFPVLRPLLAPFSPQTGFSWWPSRFNRIIPGIPGTFRNARDDESVRGFCGGNPQFDGSQEKLNFWLALDLFQLQWEMRLRQI